MERGDAVSIDVDIDYRKGASLTAGEIAMLKTFSARGRISSIPLSNPDRFLATSDTAAFLSATESVRLHGSPW
jgi:hypothetical protein